MTSYIHAVKIFLIVVLTTSCGTDRPENAEYFRTVTKIDLCSVANISNRVHAFDDNSFEPTYAVEVFAPKSCIDNFAMAVQSRIGGDCSKKSCYGFDGKMDYIQFERKSAEKAYFRISFAS